MKKLFLIILLSIAAPTWADHHRGHALGFLDVLDLHRNQFDNKLALFASSCSFNAEDATSLEVLSRYSGFLQGNSQIVRDMLNDELTDLEAVRRVVNQPNGEKPGSANKLILGLNHRARMLIDSCNDGNVYLAQMFQRLALSWEAIDRVIWHIDDAIREEIYLDPDFAL